MTKLVCLPCLLVLLGAAESLYAQATPARAQVVQLQAPAPVQFAPPVAEAASESPLGEPHMVAPSATAEAATPQDAKAAAEAQKKAAQTQQKLQVIKKLQFDRKPSSILRVWHEHEKQKVDEAKKAEEEAKKQAEAKPTEEAEASKEEDASEAKEEEASSEKSTTPAEDATTEADDSTEASEGAGTPQAEGATPQDAQREAAAAETPAEEPAEPPFPELVKELQRDVTLGRWDEVKAFIATQDEAVAKALYHQLLQSLGGTPPQVDPSLPPELFAQLMQAQQQGRSNQKSQTEINYISIDDLVALAGTAPKELDKNAIQLLGGIVRVHLANGFLADDMITRLEAEAASEDEEERPISKREVAQLLLISGHTDRAKPFLPTLEEAMESNDFEGLNLLSSLYVTLFQRDRDEADLERAWTATQEVLAGNEVEDADRSIALQRAVKLAPQVRDVLGEAWLAESFTGQPQRGIEILSTIGASAAQGLQTKANNPQERYQSMELVATAVNTLVESAPEIADQWQDKLSLLASIWLREADISYQFDASTSRGPSLRRDIYGNYFYDDVWAHQRQAQPNPRQAQPIGVTELLKIKPNETWMKYVTDAIKPEMNRSVAQLLLKVNEEDEAFPYIESLAQTHPKLAEELVTEFLRVWTANHDPNTVRNRTNHYMFMYGYERKAESIPLTRSKQQRNLKELARLVKRLQALPLEDIDEALLLRAFTTCHSSAEVYRMEAIEEVFGPVEKLDAKTLAELSQRMRINLLSTWRAPVVQNDAKTRRKQRDIQAEVNRGYGVAMRVTQQGLQSHPDDWALVLAHASLYHDLNDFLRETAPDSEYTQRREDAFADFRRAVELYSATVGEIKPSEETTKPFEVWYYASMGACDPDRLSAAIPGDPSQLPKIRDAINALPGKAAERHMAMFANTLFTRMSAVPPELKFRYVESGLKIVGDHERAIEARKIYDYYRDLLTEIELETALDGSNSIGHGRPFGLFVNIRHTREIERESGGFGRYLQNQNTGARNFFYNYGRPLENYRDKFEEYVVQAVGDKFDVLSVTFQSEDVTLRSLLKEGWRVTPYAYVMMKARSPEVDIIPSFQLDLDFLDTSGYTVIPIASAEIPVDSSGTNLAPRPVENLVITQTLDERQASEGTLVLEIEAAGQGLVPDLKDVVDLSPEGFKVDEIEDKGVSIVEFDGQAEKNVVLSERNWLVTMSADPELAERPTSFEFPAPVMEVKEVTYQRYRDADLASVDQVIALEEEYTASSLFPWIWIVPLALLLLTGLGTILASLLRRAPQTAHDPFAVPERLTPFSVLGLLNRIEAHNGLDDSGRAELRRSKLRIERSYFVNDDDSEPNVDLAEIATQWSQRASRNGHN